LQTFHDAGQVLAAALFDLDAVLERGEPGALVEGALTTLREIAAQDGRVPCDLKAYVARLLLLGIFDVVNRHVLDGLCGWSWQGDLPGEERDARPLELVARS